jgi:YD repeat-containing protein
VALTTLAPASVDELEAYIKSHAGTAPENIATAYSEIGRAYLQLKQLGNVKTFVYDFNGNRTQDTDESSRVVTYAYDGLNRQTQIVVDPGGGHLNLTTTTTYDPTPGVIGTSSTTTNPAGQAITTYLDGLGRTSLITGNTATVQYTYDVVIAIGPNAGLVQTTVATDPSGVNLTTSSLTNGAGWTMQTLDGFNHATSFTYDNNGNTLTTTDRDGKITTNTYDQRNRTLTTQGDTGGINANTAFIYDPTSNLTQVTDADGKVTVYAYDTANRRLTTTYASGTAQASTWTVAYEPLGQILTLTKPNGVVITYSYEHRELLSQRVYTQGMTTLGTDTFTYFPNRLLATANGGLYTTVVDRSVLNTSYDMANRLTAR